MDGQRGLPDPGRTGHGHDRDGVAVLRGRREQFVELRELVPATGESPRRCRELPRHGRRRAGPVERRVGVQDLAVQLPQRRARVGPQLVGESAPQRFVPLQRLGLAAAAVERPHQLAHEPLVGRVGFGVGGQSTEDSGMLAEVQGQVVAVQFGREPLGLQAVADGVRPRRVQAGQRLATPQLERAREQVLRLRGVGGRSGPSHQRPEAVQVDRRRIDHDDVAAAAPRDAQVVVRGQRPPQPRQVAREDVAGPLGARSAQTRSIRWGAGTGRPASTSRAASTPRCRAWPMSTAWPSTRTSRSPSRRTSTFMTRSPPSNPVILSGDRVLDPWGELRISAHRPDRPQEYEDRGAPEIPRLGG